MSVSPRLAAAAVAAAAAAALVAGDARARAAQADRFRPLFNGRDLSGWVNINCAPNTFSVRDGMLASTGAPICELRTDRMYENFVLELEYQHEKAGGNAGVFIWADALPARGQPFLRAIEIQVLDGRNTDNYTSHGDIFPIHGARMTPDRPHPGGWVRSLPRERRAKPAGEWNHYRITANRGAISLEVNGKEVTTGTEASPRKGYIAIESEGSPALFRNIRIRELPPDPALAPDRIARPAEGFESLYTGIDLSGWTLGPRAPDTGAATSPPAAAAVQRAGPWVVKDWTLVYEGSGAGAPLVSDRSFGDAVVFFDWRVPKDAVVAAGGAVPAARRSAGFRAMLEPGPVPGLSPGEWHRTTLTLRGDSASITIDGGAPVAGGVGLPARGRLALVPGPPGTEYANIFVKPLD